MNPKLYLFDTENPKQTSYEIEFSNHDDVFHISNHELEISPDEKLQVTASLTIDNLAYSIIIKSNEKHLFSFMGVKKEQESSDPCIMITIKNNRVLQIALSI